MNVLAHPLFFVFAFTLLIFIAGIWWLLCNPRERTDDEQWSSSLREKERTVMEILEDTVPSGAPKAVSATFSEPHKKDVAFRREETKSRLAVLDDLIAKQRSRIASAGTIGLDTTLLKDQLKSLTHSHEEHCSALKRLLSDFVDSEKGNGGKL